MAKGIAKPETGKDAAPVRLNRIVAPANFKISSVEAENGANATNQPSPAEPTGALQGLGLEQETKAPDPAASPLKRMTIAAAALVAAIIAMLIPGAYQDDRDDRSSDASDLASPDTAPLTALLRPDPTPETTRGPQIEAAIREAIAPPAPPVASPSAVEVSEVTPRPRPVPEPPEEVAVAEPEPAPFVVDSTPEPTAPLVAAIPDPVINEPPEPVAPATPAIDIAAAPVEAPTPELAPAPVVEEIELTSAPPQIERSPMPDEGFMSLVTQGTVAALRGAPDAQEAVFAFVRDARDLGQTDAQIKTRLTAAYAARTLEIPAQFLTDGSVDSEKIFNAMARLQ